MAGAAEETRERHPLAVRGGKEGEKSLQNEVLQEIFVLLMVQRPAVSCHPGCRM